MTSGGPESMVLGAYLSYAAGHHAAAWRSRETADDGAWSVHHYARLVQTAESGLFDFIFLADTPSVFNDDRCGYGGRVVGLEPITLLSALAMVTRDIGLIATASTTYTEPYNIARQFATLDHVSHGRAGWNVVTSSKSEAAANFGRDAHPDHDIRYRRAAEYFAAVTALWDSWEDDAFPRDRRTGLYYDPQKRHAPELRGEYIACAGELNVARPPQGHPVIVQAGSSDAGVGLAAQTADLVFTAQRDSARSKSFTHSLHRRAAQAGRREPYPLVLPGISPYACATKSEAEDQYRSLQDLIHPTLGLGMLSDLLGGIDLSQYDIDGKLPDLPPSNGNQSKRAMIERLAREDGLTIRQLYLRLTAARGHLTVVGSYDDVADTMASWYATGAADGFNVMPPVLPTSLDCFVEHVIPRLQRLGVFHDKYAQGTLREKLCLPRPHNRHSLAGR